MRSVTFSSGEVDSPANPMVGWPENEVNIRRPPLRPRATRRGPVAGCGPDDLAPFRRSGLAPFAPPLLELPVGCRRNALAINQHNQHLAIAVGCGPTLEPLGGETAEAQRRLLDHLRRGHHRQEPQGGRACLGEAELRGQADADGEQQHAETIFVTFVAAALSAACAVWVEFVCTAALDGLLQAVAESNKAKPRSRAVRCLFSMSCLAAPIDVPAIRIRTLFPSA